MYFARARAALVVAALAVPGVAHAESAGGTGQGGLSASASVNFKIVIPQVLALNVAAGANAQASLQPASSSNVIRGTRGGMALPSQPDVILRSNMRQVTVVQDTHGQTVYTVVTP
jgi:hypothetical protein